MIQSISEKIISLLKLETGKKIKVKFEFQKSSLQQPENPNTNVFMIANSTGIAPFRAFLHQKQWELKNENNSHFGKTVLLFGCRHRNTDYIFEDEMEKDLLHDPGD